jgi:hypothetical protein
MNDVPRVQQAAEPRDPEHHETCGALRAVSPAHLDAILARLRHVKPLPVG